MERRTGWSSGGFRQLAAAGRDGQREIHGTAVRALFSGVLMLLPAMGVAGVQAPSARAPTASPQHRVEGGETDEQAARAKLQKGIELTRKGDFAPAIPLLRAAIAEGAGGYAGEFNLALCYVATGRYAAAIPALGEIRQSPQNAAAVNNLLAQAYLGEKEPQKAWQAIQAAARATPADERMYAFLMNACTDHYDYGLGLKVAELGLQSLPQSSRLHYERAVFLARLDRLEEAKPEFAKAADLGGESDLGYLARVQERLYEDREPEALEVARKAVRTGHGDPQMLSLLGTVLMHAGAAPGQTEFAEARSALERSVAARGDFPTSQIALGKLYLMEGRAADAVVHLEIGRRLEPLNPAVYTSLAAAYRGVGDKEAAQASLRTLGALLRERSGSAGSLPRQP